MRDQAQSVVAKAKRVWNRCVCPACDPPRIVQHDYSLTRTILTSRTRKAVRTAERAKVHEFVASLLLRGELDRQQDSDGKCNEDKMDELGFHRSSPPVIHGSPTAVGVLLPLMTH